VSPDIIRRHRLRPGLEIEGRAAPPKKGSGEQERQGTHEVRGDAQQDPSLAARFEHQPQIAVLQIAEAAVDQPGRAAARASRHVAFIHEGDAKAAQRRVARDARAGDPAADDQHVHRLGGHRVECGGAGLERERRLAGQLPSGCGRW